MFSRKMLTIATAITFSLLLFNVLELLSVANREFPYASGLDTLAMILTGGDFWLQLLVSFAFAGVCANGYLFVMTDKTKQWRRLLVAVSSLLLGFAFGVEGIYDARIPISSFTANFLFGASIAYASCRLLFIALEKFPNPQR